MMINNPSWGALLLFIETDSKGIEFYSRFKDWYERKCDRTLSCEYENTVKEQQKRQAEYYQSLEVADCVSDQEVRTFYATLAQDRLKECYSLENHLKELEYKQKKINNEVRYEKTEGK